MKLFGRVIAFVETRELVEEQGKRMAIEKLALKYAPEDSADGRKRAIECKWRTLCVLEMTIFHMTGKEAIELINVKEQKSRPVSHLNPSQA